MKARVLHITGPCCAGKSHVIGQLTARHRLSVWDANVQRKKYGTTAAAIPRLSKQLRPGTTLVVESSGQNRRLNATLDSRADVRTIRLQGVSGAELSSRAHSRGMRPGHAKEFNARFTWPDGVGQDLALQLAGQWAISK